VVVVGNTSSVVLPQPAASNAPITINPARVRTPQRYRLGVC
jgi:hypothetical protein